ncbi:GNAT family N-acetyltransferase [Micromonospora sp. BL1]|uniref:GNAT family N-acetyltransferase n=1 Tax=Micromonospora tulbaghiae TaxID=479978 RepID=A0AAW4JGS5_9ACTN|nr:MULTISPECIES: GNAT family N-acetyltransferase [Micromonospora]KAB1909847.1 GNAT family N-acetyltransferase [Micromonospora sp. AMSO1212t]MBO4140470.1 GNAT family N-acetyltransferase [Micromonospora tulbaghiae]RLQ06143.1 GNAT family N-acetyltransferase [Micromonospora sp. BL1]
MRIEILDARSTSDRERWAALHQTWSRREVFAHPAYLRLFAGPEDQPLAAYARTGSGFILYPFLLRPVDAPHLDVPPGRYHDVTSPYGYGGAFQEGADELDAKRFWESFDVFCARRNVVSEVTRLTLFDDERLPSPGPVREKLVNVVRDLRTSDEDMWREFDHKVRKNVNKARRNGVTVEVDLDGARLDDFLRIYQGTMDRRAATSGYYFPRDFFQTIIDELPGQFAFFHALHDGRVVSTELVLSSALSLYSYLGGTEQAAFDLRPNDLLKFEICRWGRAQGRIRFVLGGGYAPDDGIFRYKRAFAPHGLVPFHLGTRVLDEPVYRRLCEAHQQEGTRRDAAWSASPDFFPEYRCALPGSR